MLADKTTLNLMNYSQRSDISEKGWFPKHFTILFEFEYHLHNYWEIQHPLRTVRISGI